MRPVRSDTGGENVSDTNTSGRTEMAKVPGKGALTNAGWNSLFTLWSGIISFLLTPLLIHYLGVEHYGILLLIWSITGILGIMSLGFGEATLRYVAFHYGDRNLSGVNRVFGSTLSFYMVICILVSAVLLMATPGVVSFLKVSEHDERLMGSLLRITALAFSLGMITRVFGTIPMALQRYDLSSKINIGQSCVRAGGYAALLFANFGILHLVLWDVVSSLGTLCVQVAVIRNLSPEVRLIPSFSFRGLREILGYSFFSLLTFVFYTVFRESGKLLLGRYMGFSPIAYYGTPDNVSQRMHMLVVSSTETLLPRFSANRDEKEAHVMYLIGTWAALSVSIMLFVPIIVLLPDFLRLWINPTFARASAPVGQLLAVGYILQGSFAPAASFFRGTGKPWVVSIVLMIAGLGTLLAAVMLIPLLGVVGIGYAYLLGSVVYFVGLLSSWVYILGRSDMARLLRWVGVPLLMGYVAYVMEASLRGSFSEVTWFGFFGLGALFASITALLIIGADWVLGGSSPSKQCIERIGKSNKFRNLARYLPARKTHFF